jgi:hypothetical protein
MSYGNGCVTDTVSVLQEVYAPITITTQPIAAQEVCKDATPTDLTVSVSGGSGIGSPVYNYQWYSNATASTTGGTAIVGETDATFTPPTDVKDTFYYYCEVSYDVLPACNPVTTQLSTVIIRTTVAGTIASDQHICYNAVPNALVLSGNSGNIVKWQYSTDNTVWIDTVHTSATYALTALSNTTWYRTIVVEQGCQSDTTLPVRIEVEPTQTVTLYASHNPVCGGDTLFLMAKGGTDATYTWKSSTNGVFNWTTLGTTTDSMYSIVTSTSNNNLYYNVTMTYGPGCVSNTSATPQITILQKPSLTTTPTPDETIVEGTYTSISVITSYGVSPLTYTWDTATVANRSYAHVQRYDNQNQIITAPLFDTTYYKVTVGSANGCSASAMVTINVVPGASPAPKSNDDDLGVENAKNANLFQIYSAGNVVYIKNDNSVMIEKVEIVDVLGRILYRANAISSSIEIPLHVATGNYFVRCLTNDTVVNAKVIIQH